jgi:hypothetical protein
MSSEQSSLLTHAVAAGSSVEVAGLEVEVASEAEVVSSGHTSGPQSTTQPAAFFVACVRSYLQRGFPGRRHVNCGQETVVVVSMRVMSGEVVAGISLATHW